MSTSTIFDFQISDVSRALTLYDGFKQRGMKWVCVVIISSLKTRIEKSLSYSYLNLKSPIKMSPIFPVLF